MQLRNQRHSWPGRFPQLTQFSHFFPCFHWSCWDQKFCCSLLKTPLLEQLTLGVSLVICRSLISHWLWTDAGDWKALHAFNVWEQPEELIHSEGQRDLLGTEGWGFKHSCKWIVSVRLLCEGVSGNTSSYLIARAMILLAFEMKNLSSSLREF